MPRRNSASPSLLPWGRTNLIYLQNQCGAIVGNGAGRGICTCPTEG
jgi:hypothetical protein